LEGNFLAIVGCRVAVVLCCLAQNNGVKVLDVGRKHARCWYAVRGKWRKMWSSLS